MTLTNVILSRSDRGYVETGSLASELANGRAEKFVELGGLKDLATIHAVAERLLGVADDSYVASICGYEPAASATEPYIGPETYDQVTVLGPDGTTDPAVVRGISCVADRNGHPTWTVEVNGLAIVDQQQTDRWLRKALPGFVGGWTETANPATPATGIAVPLPSGAKQWTASKDGLLSSGALSGLNQLVGKSGHANRFVVTLTTPASTGSTTVLFKIDGVTIATVTIAAGADTGYVAFLEPFDEFAKFRVVIDAAGSGAEGLAAEVWWF